MAEFKDAMCRTAAESLFASLASIHSEHFESYRLSDQLLTHMAKLNLTEQASLARRAQHYLRISIDINALQRQMQKLQDTQIEQELEDTYLLQGAPLVLMRRLFGMHASEFSRRRQLLYLAGSGNGRPKYCDETTEHAIWNEWHAHKSLNERQRFLAVADITGIDLHVIWSALRQYIDH